MKKFNIYQWVILFFLIFLLLWRCAHKMPPSGGPEDRTPPKVISTFPQPDSVNIENLQYIEIVFSESINKTSLFGNYWIIPELPSGFELEWKGSRKVRFWLKDSLEKNRTYVFTLGTGIKDLRNNGLSTPVQLAFSTGTKLDSGSIKGRVYSDQRIEGVFIYAYPLFPSVQWDSLLFQKAPYFNQINKQGEFQLNYLAEGRYRIIALKDEDFNKIYDPETDYIGIPPYDVTINGISSRVLNINFYLIQEDTTPPKIVSVDTLSDREIVVKFDEPIHWTGKIKAFVQDTATSIIYQPMGISLKLPEKNQISLNFKDLPQKKYLKLNLLNIEDFAGNLPKDSILTTFFTTASFQDTISPRLEGIVPSDGAQDIPYDAEVQVSFSSPVDTSLFSKYFSLREKKGKKVDGKFYFIDLKKPVFKPDSILGKNKTYLVNIRLDSLKDIFGRSFSDTIVSTQFTTISWADLGDISGLIVSSDTSWNQAIIEAKAVKGDAVYRKVVKVGQEYLLPFLPAGAYLMTAIIDVNKNGVWDKGKSSPWEFSEPFIVRSDTVIVRKRWTTQGIDFYFEEGYRE